MRGRSVPNFRTRAEQRVGVPDGLTEPDYRMAAPPSEADRFDFIGELPFGPHCGWSMIATLRSGIVAVPVLHWIRLAALYINVKARYLPFTVGSQDQAIQLNAMALNKDTRRIFNPLFSFQFNILIALFDRS